jgi:hypothetical protein
MDFCETFTWPPLTTSLYLFRAVHEYAKLRFSRLMRPSNTVVFSGFRFLLNERSRMRRLFRKEKAPGFHVKKYLKIFSQNKWRKY